VKLVCQYHHCNYCVHVHPFLITNIIFELQITWRSRKLIKQNHGTRIGFVLIFFHCCQFIIQIKGLVWNSLLWPHLSLHFLNSSNLPCFLIHSLQHVIRSSSSCLLSLASLHCDFSGQSHFCSIPLDKKYCTIQTQPKGVCTLWCTKIVVTLCSFQSFATLVVHYMNMKFAHTKWSAFLNNQLDNLSLCNFFLRRSFIC
jgi:hypothetical protein